MTPSAFNSQSARAVVLFHKDHDRLWDIVTEELRKIVPEDRFAATDVKMQAFKKAYGTVLFLKIKVLFKTCKNAFRCIVMCFRFVQPKCRHAEFSGLDGFGRKWLRGFAPTL